MRKLIIFMAFLILLTGCTEKEELQTEKNGTIIFSGELSAPDFNLTAKYETPECSEKVPVSIRYLLRDLNNMPIIGESPIALDGNTVVSTTGVSVPPGNYTVNDIALLSSDGTVVQRMPNKLTTGFDFTNFVDISTPFDILVTGGEEVTLTGDVLCYSIQEGDFGDGVINGIFTIKELQTMYLRITDSNLSCIDRIDIEIAGRVTDSITLAGPGLYSTPVPTGLFGMEIIVFSGDAQIASRTMINTYNPDGILNRDDIIEFQIDCDAVDSGPAQLFDYRDGGIVVWVDPSDPSHGLVCAITDQGGEGAPWGCMEVEVMAPDQDPESLNHNGTKGAIGTGAANTSNILYSCPGEPNIAARLSDNYSTTVDDVLYDDWFLPSSELLKTMYLNKDAIDATALANGGTAFSDSEYWSSSHAYDSYLLIAYYQNFIDNGEFNGAIKSATFRVRSVRAF